MTRRCGWTPEEDARLQRAAELNKRLEGESQMAYMERLLFAANLAARDSLVLTEQWALDLTTVVEDGDRPRRQEAEVGWLPYKDR